MKTSQKLLHWTPRIICILAILFVSLFAADAFAPGLTIWQQLGDFFMHLIPSIILLAILLVAWKWEFIGGILFTIIGLALTPPIFLLNRNRHHFSIEECVVVVLMITFPFVVVGILFIVSHFIKKRNQIKTQLEK